MKRVLIIGAAGFVGNHLIDYICMNRPEWSVVATKLPNETIDKAIPVRNLDITQKGEIITLLTDLKPDFIFHLAAQSSVALSWKNPKLTININIMGCINVLDAIREWGGTPRILLIGSGEEYGYVRDNEIPIREDNNTRPGNIYAVTKVCQNMIGRLYAEAYGMQIMSTRSFNHTGPNQTTRFVIPDFCKQVADIEAGLREPIIRVGNLSARRDFTDVRDVVRAYCLLMEYGKAGETYNVGSGHALEIREILNTILALSVKHIAVEVDPNKFRPVDIPIIEADIFKLTQCTGWQPEIPIEATIKETLNSYRSKNGILKRN